MTVRSKSYFQSLLVTGYLPQQADFADLVDSYSDVGTGVIGTVAAEISGGAITASRVTGVVASISRLATGKFQVSFTAAQADDDYVVAVTIPDDNSAPRYWYLSGVQSDYGTSSFVFYTVNDGIGPVDVSFLRVAVLRFGAGSTIPAGAVALLSDVKSSGVDGGTSSTSYATRTLNTEVDPFGIVTLSSNQFTLAPGRYLIKARAPAYNSGQHKIRLYDVTNAAVAEVGSAAYSGTSPTGADRDSCLTAIVTPTASTTYRIEHKVTSSNANNGLGVSAGFGDSEVYTQVEITRLGA